MKKIRLNVDGDCPLCHHEEEAMYHLFKNYDLTKSISLNVEVNCPNPNNSDFLFIDWLEQIWRIILV